MRINEIKSDQVQASLDASELVCLSNIMYFYERHHSIEKDASKPGRTFNALYSQVVTARDLCQYGRMTGHTLGDVAAHELAVCPEGDLARKLEQLRAARKDDAQDT